MPKKLEKNQIVIEGNLVYIHLRGKHGEGKVTIVDLKSYKKYNLANYIWVGDGHAVKGSAMKQGYAIAWDSENKKSILLHRLISKNTSRNHTDHRNGYTLDNREMNLRICSNRENQYNVSRRKDNTTGYKNVSQYDAEYRCSIRVDGVKWYLGSYPKAHMAAYAYNLGIDVIAPKFGNKNFIPEGFLTTEDMEIVKATVEKRLAKIAEKKEKRMLEVNENVKFTNNLVQEQIV